MKTHELKILPEYFEAVFKGSKTFEVRKTDRDFAVGDHLKLKEWFPHTKWFSGGYILVEVTYLMSFSDFSGISKDYCAMGFRRIEGKKHKKGGCFWVYSS